MIIDKEGSIIKVMLEAILILFLLLCIIISSIRRPKNFPNGPNGILCLPYIAYDSQKFFDWVGYKYGGISGIVIPGYKLLVANSKKVIFEILSNQNCQGRPEACFVTDRFDGANRGIIFTDGDSWKENRKFLLYHLRSLGFGQLGHDIVIGQQRDLMLEYIYQLKEKPLGIEDFFYLPNINIIWRLIGGISYPLESKELSLIRQSLKDIIHNMSITGGITVVFPFLRYIFPDRTGYTPLKRGSRNLRYFSMQTIQQHKETLDPDKPRDFIDIYLTELEKQSDVREHFTELELEGVCMDMLIAADTTVATLTFAILHICLNKDIQNKIYNEIISEIGQVEKIVYEHRTKLVYTEAFLLELLRYKTPAPTVVPHRVVDDSVISGYKIPKDTVVFLNLKTIFMDKDHWIDPETFRPERFITEDRKIKKDEWLIPFSKGKRSCFGEVVAKRVMLIWFSSLIQKFSIAFEKGKVPKSTTGSPTFLVAPPKFKIVCTPRQYQQS